MKGMIYVLTICGAALAAVVAAVRYLRLPQEYIWYTAALLSVVVVIAAIISFIRFLQAKRNAVAKAAGKSRAGVARLTRDPDNRHALDRSAVPADWGVQPQTSSGSVGSRNSTSHHP